MWSAKSHHFSACWMLLALGLATPLAHSDTPRVEINTPALNLDLETIRAADWPERSQPVIDRWLNEHYEEMAPDDSDSAIDTHLTREALSRLMSHGAGIGHELLSANEALASYSHYRFVRTLSPNTPRVAFVAMADRTRYLSRYNGAARYSGDIGVQFAVLGSPELKLKDGRGQLLLRVMPFGGSLEQAQLGFYRSHKYKDPEAPIHFSGALETEANLKWGNIQPGGRVRLQSELETDGELRMLSEVYVKVEIKHKFDDFREISIVPRCVWDRAWGDHDRSSLPNSSFAKSYDKLHSVQVCTLNIRFRYGKRY